MRLRFVTTGLGTGGAEFALLRLCRALQRQHVEPHVVSLTGRGDLAGAFEQSGVPVITTDLRQSGAWLGLRRLFSALDRATPANVLQGWMYHGNLVGGWFAPRGIPVAWGIRQSLRANRDKAATRAVVRLNAALSRRPAAIVYNSVAGRAEHEAMGFVPARGCVIANGIETELFAASGDTRARVRREFGWTGAELVIGHIGRYHPSKDHESFLRAFAALAQRHPGARAALAGSGVDASNARLARLASELGIEQRVRLLGQRTDIAALLSSLDVFCSSSMSEGLPNAVAEAMSCGLPCVVTDVGDSKMLVGDAGIAVPPADVAALAAALSRLAEAPGATRQQLGAAARARITAHFSIEAAAAEYLRLYKLLMQGIA